MQRGLVSKQLNINPELEYDEVNLGVFFPNIITKQLNSSQRALTGTPANHCCKVKNCFLIKKQN